MSKHHTCPKCGGSFWGSDMDWDELCADCLKELHAECEAQIAALTAANAKLQAIVDKLPKTADGVAVMPGMKIWLDDSDGPVERVDTAICTTPGPQVHWYEPIWSQCYSTRAAAEAAKEKD